MPPYKYVVELSEQDKTVLLEIVSKGTSTARKILRANILLASDKQSDKYMTVAEIAEAYHHAYNCSNCKNILLRKGA